LKLAFGDSFDCRFGSCGVGVEEAGVNVKPRSGASRGGLALISMAVGALATF